MDVANPPAQEPIIRPKTRRLCEKEGIVVIDDDPLFCEVIHAVAVSRQLPVRCYESLFEMGSFAMLREYDLAILDYRLDHLNGVEIAEYVDTFFSEVPVLLVSGDEQLEESLLSWPQAVKRFVPKTQGPFAIVDAAIEILERQAFLQNFSD